MKFWSFLAALVILIVGGAILYRLVYTLRTGRDLNTDRANAAAAFLNAARTAAQPQAAVQDPERNAMPPLPSDANFSTLDAL